MKKLINKCKRKDSVITGIGKNLDYWHLPRSSPFRKETKNRQFVDLIEGWTGVAYKKKHLDTSIVRYILQNSCKSCQVSDDLVLSAAIHFTGYKIQTLGNNDHIRELSWSRGTDAIHRGGGSDKEYIGHGGGGADAHYDNYRVCLDKIMYSRAFIYKYLVNTSE